MATTAPDEVRCRVTIDKDMGELYDRLANTKRQPREIVHLLRLGLMYENILSGRVPVAGAGGVSALMVSESVVAGGGRAATPASQERQARGGTRKQDAADPAASAKSSPASVESFVEATGLDATFFSAKPPAYN